MLNVVINMFSIFIENELYFYNDYIIIIIF